MLIFLPIVFSGKAFDFNLLFKSITGFFAFSLVASIVYIVNDINDLENDRSHPRKKSRPLATGLVSKKQAFTIVGILAFSSIALMALFLNSPLSVALLTLYLIINIAYSFGLKNIPLVDVSIIVAGFILRVEFGGAIIAVPITSWMFLTVMAMSFYLALGKRRNEIQKNGHSSREVLKRYTEQFLDKMMYVSLGLTIVFYSLWCMAPNEVINNSERLIWTVPLFLLICMKYSMDVECDSHGDPAEILYSDKALIGLVLFYGMLLAALVYAPELLKLMGV
ncbi:MAG: UbiA prenyltransferase family protein [Eubacteriales bacterium]|nr:UbiA prenyltransferase family protein [Eubacteriales bacterium]